MESIKDFFRRANIFIIDDIQFANGKEAMQEEFFHTFNALIERGSQIVISSDRPPSDLNKIQERIKSRMSGGLVIDIQPPDFHLKIKILKKKYEEIKLNNKNIKCNKFLFNASNNPKDKGPFPEYTLWYDENDELMKFQFTDEGRGKKTITIVRSN